jgi:ABC-2 type transport system ATP-binding protein
VAIIDQGKLMVLDKPDALKQTVGEGDVLEITLINQKEPIELDFSFLEDRAQILIMDNILQIRALDLVNLLQSILTHLHDSGIQTGDIRLRKNTLEDVFIKLTGRRLRE